MALFEKNPHTRTDTQALYSLGQEKTILLVGLGNKGKKYDGTRHNLGFACLDAFAEDQGFPTWTEKKDLKCLVTTKTLGGSRVFLAKPTTYMNLSGEAVQALLHFYKIALSDLVIVHDELDIPFGQIRLRTGGSAAGHNGLKSVMQHIDEGFGRVRIGIHAIHQMDAADFVLAKFTKPEQEHLPALRKEVISILTETVFSGQLPNDTRQFIA